MFRTLQGFVFLWVLVQSFLGFMIRKIYPFAPKNGGRIAVWLAIQALTGFMLLVAFVLSNTAIYGYLRRVLIESWGF